MKCTNCGNKYLNRYKFILSTIFFKNQNSIKCDNCNNLSKLNRYELFIIRAFTYLTIIAMIFVICTINKFHYNLNILSLFSIAFLGIIISIVFIELIKDTSIDKTKIYINISNTKSINNIKFVFIYLLLLIVLSTVSFVSDKIFVEMNSFLFIPSMTIVFIPLIVSIIMFDIFPEKKKFLIKTIYIKFIIFSLLLLYFLFNNINKEGFSALNLLYFFTIPLIISFFCISYIEIKVILNEKFTFPLKLGVILILNFLILSAQPYYVDEEEYYFNIEKKGMTIFNKVQKSINYKLLNEEELKKAIHYYDVASKEEK